MRNTTWSRRAPRFAARSLVVLAALLIAAPVLLAACGGDDAGGPSGDPHISGAVKSTTPVAGGSAVASLFVDKGSGDYDSAFINVADETDWYQRVDGKVEPIEIPSATSLVGRSVEVQFTGAVAESYPVQATAAWVIVEE